MHRNKQCDPLPLVIAGPILRKCSAKEITLWLTTSRPLSGNVFLYYAKQQQPFFTHQICAGEQVQIGRNAWVCLLRLSGEFPLDRELQYQIATEEGDLTELDPSLLYGDEERISFSIHSRADYMLHGSCRNPHHGSKDSLVAADNKVSGLSISERPALLMMSGDQIYADHVAGPMLDAIQQVIGLLGLPDEKLSHALVPDSQALFQHDFNFYARERILPHYSEKGSWLSDDSLLSWLPRRSKPVFSSRESENHLITFSEFFAMYLLVWSPVLWQRVNSEQLKQNGFVSGQRTLEAKWQNMWHQEKQHMDEFVAGLSHCRRLMAHIPTYMIFDDHDVTDDWNLTVGWERAAYSNPFSNRVIGNGLISYWLCQGWGNEPQSFDGEFLTLARHFFAEQTEQSHDAFISHLYAFEKWHFDIDIKPKVVVLDTRTRRWRSESKMNKPSGLMDWEALCELQQSLLHEDSVIIVSAAPMFGVKFIEALQRVMTWLGQPLLIDAENWMAHPGAANTLLSIFTHTKTPGNFIILSGDVHYSFAYDIKLRFRRNSPNIYQITSSGIKNEFPAGLLNFCELMDRVLYSSYSPLNWFTKRKRLRIKKRSPDTSGQQKVVNTSAIGELYIGETGAPETVQILTGEGKSIQFISTQQNVDLPK